MRKRFTLIELLAGSFAGVLVTVAALSAAGTASREAGDAVCRNTLKKIGSAVHLYADDNGAFIPCRVRDSSIGNVVDFGTHLIWNERTKAGWAKALIWGGYFGEKVAGVCSAKAIQREKMKYFICPEDKVALENDATGSYFIFTINEVQTARGKYYGDEQYSRVNIKRDRPENCILFDTFPYRGSNPRYRKTAHGAEANVLRLDGSVDTIEITRAAKVRSVWDWIGEFADEIEL